MKKNCVHNSFGCQVDVAEFCLEMRQIAIEIFFGILNAVIDAMYDR